MLSKEALHKRAYTEWSYLYEVLEQAKQITVEQSLPLGPELTEKGPEETF